MFVIVSVALIFGAGPDGTLHHAKHGRMEEVAVAMVHSLPEGIEKGIALVQFSRFL